ASGTPPVSGSISVMNTPVGCTPEVLPAAGCRTIPRAPPRARGAAGARRDKSCEPRGTRSDRPTPSPVTGGRVNRSRLLAKPSGIRLGVSSMPAPQTRYAKSGDVNVAYQVVGDGPIDLLFAPGFVSHVDLYWTDPLL